MAKFTAIKVDDENNSALFWDSLRETYPVIANCLEQDQAAVVTEEVYELLAELPGFSDGPKYARHALIHCGDAGDDWCDVVASRHAVFEVAE